VRAALLACGISGALGAGLCAAGGASAATQAFGPVADSYVRADRAGTNYGSAKTLVVDGSPVANAYLRFDVKVPAGDSVTRATLRLFTTESSGSGLTVHGVGSSTWGEKTITYATAPGIGARVAASCSYRANAYVSVDVTSLVHGSGPVSVAVKRSSSTSNAYLSREAKSNRPQLVVAHAPAADTTPPDTTITAGPSGLTSDDTPTFEFTSTESPSTFQCRLDLEPVVSCSSPSTTATLADGAHTFEVAARDAAGNVDPTPAGRTFTVDATPPATATGLTATPGDASVALDWNDNAEPDLDHYDILRSTSTGGPYTVIAGVTASAYSDVAVSNGTPYAYVIDAIDTAGNHSGFSNEVPATPRATSTQPTFPIRAAFYYPWFPEAWSQNGISPFTKYNPTLGFYNSADDAVRDSHLHSLEYAKVNAGIYSWWGQGSKEDLRFPGMLSRTDATGSPVRWALYHEREGNGPDPSVAQLQSDLDYIKARYASDPAYLKVGGKPVVFAYGDANDGCGMADRWAQANDATRGFYVVLKVFSGYRTCASQPQSWHQYSPAVRTDRQPGYSFAISPEFDLTGPDPPRLARDLAAFKQAIRSMVASGEPWQLVTTFNEWGENSATESAQEWSSASGQGQYLDALNSDGQ
jgi:hypothetical protein